MRWWQRWHVRIERIEHVSDTWLENFRDGLYPSECIVDGHLRPTALYYDGERIEDYRTLVPELRRPVL